MFICIAIKVLPLEWLLQHGKGVYSLNRLDIVNQVFILILLMGVGFFARKRNLIDDALSKGISELLIIIILPAAIISSFIMEFSKALLSHAFIVFMISIVFHIIMIGFSKIVLRRYDLHKQIILRFLTIFPNISMGMPLIYGLYGKTGIFYFSFFIIPYQILFWTYGEGLFIGKKKQISIKAQLRNPNIMAVLIGIVLFVFSIKIPFVLLESLNKVGSMVIPLGMMVIGEKIALTNFKEIIFDKDIYCCSFLRMVMAPVLMFGLVTLLQLDPLIKNICVAAEVIPTATFTVILAEKYNNNAILASKCVLASHIFSMFTIPIMLIILSFS